MANPLYDIGQSAIGKSDSFFRKEPAPINAPAPVGEPFVTAQNQMPSAPTVVKSSVATKPKTEIGITSTDKAVGMVQKDQIKLDQLSGVDTNLFLKAGETPEQYRARTEAYFAAKRPTQNAPVVTTNQPKIKMLNLDGQTTELNGSAITPEAMQNLKDQGYYAIETTGDVPAWASTGDIATGKANAELDAAKKAKDDLIEGLSKFTISDEQLNAQTKTISDLYDARINDMRDINSRRAQSVKTLGVRSGNRYTGGEGGVFGGIIAEEERQGVKRIGELESEKQSAISAAREAARSGNWLIYSKKVDIAEKAYASQQDAVAKLNENLVKNNNEIKKQQIQASRDSAVGGLIEQGITDPAKLLNMLNFDESGKRIGDFTSKEIADNLKNLTVVEKAIPGIVGEWIAAKENDPAMAKFSLNDYINFKEPGRALDLKEQQLRINKLQKDISETGSDADPYQLMAYAQQYATTGAIPTGIPKGTFGIVSQAAKELPKQKGNIVNTTTGVADSKSSATEQADFSKLYNIINNVRRLKELDEKRIGGVLSGTLGAVFGSVDQDKYLKTRKAIVDDMSRMQSGAALTPDEIATYENYLPGRFSESFGLGVDSMKQLETFEELIDNRLKERLSTNGLSMYGYSKVNVGGKEYTAGDIISNGKGQNGRVNPDGTITLLQ